MRRMVALFLAAIALLPAEASASCAIDKLSLFLNQDSQHSANLRISGASTSCGDHYWAGGNTEFHSLRLVTRPRHGQVGPDGAYSQISFKYTRRPNWKGKDSFSIRLCGAYRGGKGCALITYNVIAE